MQTITFNSSTVNQVQTNSSSGLTISNYNSIIEGLFIQNPPTGYIVPFLFLDGDFNNTSINLGTNCNLNCTSLFKCNNPIYINSDNSLNIYISGDFSNVLGFYSNSNFSIYCSSNTTSISNLKVTLNNESSTPLNFSFSGSSYDCSLTVNGPYNINLSSTLKELIVNNDATNSKLNLLSNATVSNCIINTSNLNVGGDPTAVSTFVANPDIKDKTTITSYSFIVNVLNGLGTGNFSIKFPNHGKYQLSASLSDDDRVIPFGSSLSIDI